MPNPTAGEAGALNINQMQDVAMNMVETLCSILVRPLEIILRPFHGTRYFPPPVIFFSSMMMILLPLIGSLIHQANPLSFLTGAAPVPRELFGLGAFSQLYFLLSFAHGIRLYRRMFNMSLEQNSQFEGPPLFFFSLFPKGLSFWFTRIFWEPLFVLAAAIFLGRIYIFQSGLVTYLEICALALAMKQFIHWYRAWEYMRTILDMRFAAPIIARMSENAASDEELATIHLASFPANLPEDIRQATVEHLARAFSPGGNPPSTKGSSHEHHT